MLYLNKLSCEYTSEQKKEQRMENAKIENIFVEKLKKKKENIVESAAFETNISK